jgi:methyl-accepting chemotaxis protein
MSWFHVSSFQVSLLGVLGAHAMSLLPGLKVRFGEKRARKADARVASLARAAGRIGDLVMLVTSLVEKANLLALNATIEAARAGEAEGFAVAFQDVKALADQTAKAADEIYQIASTHRVRQDSVLAIAEIGGTIGRISEIAAAIAAAVEVQGAAKQTISRGIQPLAPKRSRANAAVASSKVKSS